MEKLILSFVLLCFLTITINGKEVITEDDLYLTNTSHTYSEIPDDCRLFGKNFEKHHDIHGYIVNITSESVFWVSATIKFRRRLNPIGMEGNCAGETGTALTLDDCNKQCKGYSYLHYSDKTCTCTNDGKIDEGLIKAEPCESGLCSSRKCIIYERVKSNQFTCDTYRYTTDYGGFWLYNTSNCSEKMNYSCICDHGEKKPDMGQISWYDAYQRCQEDGYTLLQTNAVTDTYKDGRTYWVSFFRRLDFSWGTNENKDICVAAKINENGTLSLVSKFCSERLQSLCSTSQKRFKHNRIETNTKDSSLVWIVGPCVGFIIVAGAVIFGIVKYRRHQRLKYLEGIIKDNQSEIKDIELLDTDNETKVSHNPEYALSATYSDPINCALKSSSKDINLGEYAQVTKTSKKSSDDKSQRLNLIFQENPYQTPVS